MLTGHPFEVVREPLERVRVRSSGRLATAVPARVVRHHVVRVRKGADLRPEIASAAAEAVREHDRGALPFGFDVEAYRHYGFRRLT